ncbi:MAG: hypothetical protein K2P92_03625 [Bdellovibrionaceae bacterium]|nr:hypothetical protein [Pseudobdellovibrionaceae bacterium]
MNKLTFNGHPICLVHCSDDSLYRNRELISSVDEYFLRIMNTGHKAREQVGHVISTVGIADPQIFKEESIKKLLAWHLREVIKLKGEFGKPEAEFVQIDRIWFNRMFQNSSGRRHNHFDTVDGVAIFYLQAPENSGRLLFYEHEKSTEPCHVVTPQDGLLVLHSPHLWHSIAVHEAIQPRTVMGFEFKFI